MAIIDSTENFAEQWGDYAQATGVDTSDTGDAIRKGLKEAIEIRNEVDMHEAKKEDMRIKREHEHVENMARIKLEEKKAEVEEKKIKTELVKVCVIGGVVVTVTVVTVFGDMTGSAISKVGQSVASLAAKFML